MRRTRSRFSWSLLATVAVPALADAKTDIVVFTNGDKLTGEVKSLERGRLRFKTDATGTINIEWDDVAYLSSDQNIQVETSDGTRYLGSLGVAATEGLTVVNTSSGPIELSANEVVLMAPIKEKGINRIDGDITFGLNFTKASEIKQLHFGLDMHYRTETRIVSLLANATTSDSTDSESSQRHSAELTYRRLWPNRWVTGGLLSLNRNDELGLDLRTSVGAGGGRILRQSNSVNLLIEGGLLLSRENLASGVPSEDTWEALAALQWEWFRYDSPELDLSTRLQIFPNLTDTGRVRGEFDIRLKWELIEDLF